VFNTITPTLAIFQLYFDMNSINAIHIKTRHDIVAILDIWIKIYIRFTQISGLSRVQFYKH